MSNYIDKLFDRTVPMLQKDMTVRMKRSEALVSNVSNAETPGYRAVDVNFGKELERALGQQSTALKITKPGHMDTKADSGRSFLVPDYSGVTKPDGNNVDLDLQMGKLTSNAGKFSRSASIVRKKLQMLRMAIRYGQQ